MSYTRKKNEPITWEVHDHFDGSAHCVECAGECKLTGANMLLTALIRYDLEQSAIRGENWWGGCKESVIIEALGSKDSLRDFIKRANDSMAALRPVR